MVKRMIDIIKIIIDKIKKPSKLKQLEKAIDDIDNIIISIITESQPSKTKQQEKKNVKHAISRS